MLPAVSDHLTRTSNSYRCRMYCKSPSINHDNVRHSNFIVLQFGFANSWHTWILIMSVRLCRTASCADLKGANQPRSVLQRSGSRLSLVLEDILDSLTRMVGINRQSPPLTTVMQWDEMADVVSEKWNTETPVLTLGKGPWHCVRGVTILPTQ